MGERLFVAIDVPDVVKRAATRMQRELPQGTRPARAADLHLTLKFLGGVANPDALAESLATIRQEPFTITLDRVNAFPALVKPRVLFLGGPPSAPFGSLADAVDAATPQFPRDRAPTLHATIARFARPPRDLVIPAVMAHTWRADAFTLYRSRQGRYERLRVYALVAY